ncbi:MAG: dihydropteroate synthase [Sphingobacteriales bacterium]|nr:MAG: dihydropteroate synthase [Sphingobacteriales bacterium]
MHTLNCKGKLLSLEKPVVMGILNITPDSFYKGYLQDTEETVLSAAANLASNGAAIIDIGGQSTRPGSSIVSANEEVERVLPWIEKLHYHFPDIIISIDTYYAAVAKASIEAGAHIVNDISAGNLDEAMIATVASLRVPYIAMHMQGTPQTMQGNPRYINVVQEVLDFFIQKAEECRLAGIHDVIIDPGFGFGKTTAHNFSLLKNLPVFKMLEKPILTGLSRKGMVYKTLGIDAEHALNGTTVLNTLALNNGASIIRVHDAREAKEAIDLLEHYNNT